MQTCDCYSCILQDPTGKYRTKSHISLALYFYTEWQQ